MQVIRLVIFSAVFLLSCEFGSAQKIYLELGPRSADVYKSFVHLSNPSDQDYHISGLSLTGAIDVRKRLSGFVTYYNCLRYYPPPNNRTPQSNWLYSADVRSVGAGVRWNLIEKMNLHVAVSTNYIYRWADFSYRFGDNDLHNDYVYTEYRNDPGVSSSISVRYFVLKNNRLNVNVTTGFNKYKRDLSHYVAYGIGLKVFDK